MATVLTIRNRSKDSLDLSPSIAARAAEVRAKREQQPEREFDSRDDAHEMTKADVSNLEAIPPYKSDSAWDDTERWEPVDYRNRVETPQQRTLRQAQYIYQHGSKQQRADLMELIGILYAAAVEGNRR